MRAAVHARLCRVSPPLWQVDKVKVFILDECDKMLEQLDMRKTVQQIFMRTPHEKQVMMFSATLKKEIRPVALKFMSDPMEIYVESDSKLTREEGRTGAGDVLCCRPTRLSPALPRPLPVHGLQQYYVKLKPEEKNRKLVDLLDALEFNQARAHAAAGAGAAGAAPLSSSSFLSSPGGHLCV